MGGGECESGDAMTDAEIIARIQTCQLILQECLAALWARQPTSANNGKLEAREYRFPSLVAATAYLAECHDGLQKRGGCGSRSAGGAGR